MGEGVYSEGGFVDDVEVEAEQPSPDDEKGEQVAAHGVGYEEFEADYSEDEGERGEVFEAEEDFEAVEEQGVVEAGERQGGLGLGFNFLGDLVVFRGDDEDLSAGKASSVFSGVFLVEGDECVTGWAMEPD